MKILYVNTMGTWGGVATYLHALIKNQVKQGNKVYLLTGSKGNLTKSIEKEFPSVVYILLPTLDRNINVLDTLKAIFQFRKIVKKINPDIVHLNCIMSGIVGRLGLIGLSPKIVYNAHGWDFEPRVSKKVRILAVIIEKILSYFTDKIICVSYYEYKIANKYHIFRNKEQPIVINNGAKLIRNVNNIKPHDHKFVITMAARFKAPKDQKLMIFSFYKLLKKNNIKNNIYLYLLGNGPNLKYCTKLVNKLGLGKNIIFPGMVSNVNYYYYKSNLVVLITKSEAISLSLIEAMSTKKPIVASHVGGIPELIHGNGICVNNDINSISKSLDYLISHPLLCKSMGEKSYQLYSKYFTQKEMIKKTNLLYKNLLKN